MSSNILRTLSAINRGINPVKSLRLDFTPDFIKELVTQADNKAEEVRNFTDGNIHVSTLINGFCPRKHAIIQKFNFPVEKKFVQSNDRIVWKIGRAVENHVRDSFIEVFKHENFYGVWKCKCEYTSFEGRYSFLQPACPRCGTFPNRYHEVTLKDEVLGITGNPDTLFMMPESSKLYVLEVKSIKNRPAASNPNDVCFENLKAPIANHVLQAACYRRLLKELGKPVADTACIFYVSKDYRRDSPYKDYHVNIGDDSSWWRTVNLFWESVKLYRDSLAADIVPERTVCKSMHDKMAKKCNVISSCFGS